MHNDLVTSNNKKIQARGDFNDEETTKNSESLSDKKEESKEKLVAPISENKNT